MCEQSRLVPKPGVLAEDSWGEKVNISVRSTGLEPGRRNPLTVQLVHERVKQLCSFFPQSGDLLILDDPAGAAPAHDGFADRRVPVSPRVNFGSLSRFRTADIRMADANRRAGTGLATARLVSVV